MILKFKHLVLVVTPVILATQEAEDQEEPSSKPNSS
jgi:hypothetical protein